MTLPAFTTFFDAASGGPLPLPEAIEVAYGQLALPERLLYANFVSSLDGVAAISDVTASSRVIGMGDPADRLLMALLRGCAEVVVIGAGTFREHKGPWTAEQAFPAAADDLAELRRRLGLPPYPILFVVSKSGRLEQPEDKMRGVVVVGNVAELEERLMGFSRVLTEGGPHLMGDLLEAGLVDELFLTLSPVVLGGADGQSRPGFAAGIDLLEAKSTAELVSARGSESHVFLRYALQSRGRHST